MRWVIVFLLFLMLVPFTFANLEECNTYSDCPKKDCIGYTRECFAGECRYSDCLIDISLEGREGVQSFQSTLDEYKVDTKNTFGLKPIIILAGKVVLVALILFIAALLMSAFGLKGFFKLVFFIVIIMVVVGSLFFFSGSGLFNLFGVSSLKGGTENSIMKSFSEENGYEIQSRDVLFAAQGVYDEQVEYAKEFSLVGHDDEVNLVVIGSVNDIDLTKYFPSEMRFFKQKNVSGETVFYQENDFSSVNMFSFSDKFFYLTGEKFKVKKLLHMFINQSYVFEYDEKPQNIIGSTIYPAVEILVPKNNSMSNQPMFSFRVYKGEFTVNSDDLYVTGVDGFYNAIDNCIYDSETYDCNFYGEGLKQGWNWFIVEAIDEEANEVKSVVNFFYDSYPPEIMSTLSGEEVSNSLTVGLEMMDSGAGVNLDSIKVIGLDFLEDCTGRIDGYSCSLYPIGDLDDGEYNFTIMIKDKVGNQALEKIDVILDTKKPSITYLDEMIILSDTIGLDSNSFYVDNKKYDLSSCQESVDGFKCQIRGFRYLRVSDIAGNMNSFEYVKTR